MNFIEKNIFSIITAIIAIIALWQTHRQIKISNKHQLFNKRVDKFMLITGLMSLFKESKPLMKKENYNSFIDVTVLFHSLTNNTYLKDVGNIIDNINQEDIRQNFLVKLEELKRMSIEVEFLFSKNNIKLIQDFIYEYQELLRKIYEEQIILYKIMETNRKNPTSFIKLQKEFGEKEYRQKLYSEYDKIKSLYDEVVKKDIMKNIKKQIKF